MTLYFRGWTIKLLSNERPLMTLERYIVLDQVSNEITHKVQTTYTQGIHEYTQGTHAGHTQGTRRIKMGTISSRCTPPHTYLPPPLIFFVPQTLLFLVGIQPLKAVSWITYEQQDFSKRFKSTVLNQAQREREQYWAELFKVVLLPYFLGYSLFSSFTK